MTPSLLTLFACFPFSGLMTVLLGVLLPVLAALYGLNDSRAGALFAIQFLAATTSSSIYGWTAARWPAPGVAAASYLWMAAGAALFIPSGLAMSHLAVASYGLGLGLNIASVNLAAAQSARGRSVQVLNLLNMFWGAGAVAGPVAVSWALRRWPFQAVMGALCLALLAASACSWRFSPPLPPTPEAPARLPKQEASPAFPRMEFLYLFLYVGVENCISGWLPTLGIRLLGTATLAPALAQSAFWLAILAGRGLSAAWAATRPHSWMASGLALAITGTAICVTSPTPASFLLGAFLAGLGLAPQFPTSIALYQQRTGDAGRKWLGLLLAGGGLGGAALPWLLGVVAHQVGGLATAVSMVTALAAAMLAMVWSARFNGCGPSHG